MPSLGRLATFSRPLSLQHNLASSDPSSLFARLRRNPSRRLRGSSFHRSYVYNHSHYNTGRENHVQQFRGRRHHEHLPTVSSRAQSTSNPPSKDSTSSSPGPNPRTPQMQRGLKILAVLITSLAGLYLLAPETGPTIKYTTQDRKLTREIPMKDLTLTVNAFHPFVLAERQHVGSPGSDLQIITLRPKNLPRDDLEEEMMGLFYGRCVHNGTSHVLIAHPGMQVEREYSPLPQRFALSRVSGAGKEVKTGAKDGEARGGVGRFDIKILLRPVADGSVSPYLCSLPLGSDIQVRASEPNFNLLTRGGLSSPGTTSTPTPSAAPETRGTWTYIWDKLWASDTSKEPVNVRFLYIVGGTGVAAALQAVEHIQESVDPVGLAVESTVLWATRESVSTSGKSNGTQQTSEKATSGMALTPPSLASRVGTYFHNGQSGEAVFKEGTHTLHLRLFPRESNKRISAADITAALLECSASKNPTRRPVADPRCRLHSQAQVVRSSEWENDDGKRCVCGDGKGGKNVVVVCGPPGFVEFYAGAKVEEGMRQGEVGGVVGEVGRKMLGDWVVLKM